MRDFLEDAYEHRQDGYGRAQAHAKRELPKRFYKLAAAEAVEGGFAVTLDGRRTKTPGRTDIVLPNQELAGLLAAEWTAQGERIDPETMPLVRLVNSAMEGGEAVIPALREEILKFAGNDLLLYRADTPRELVAAQEASWDAVLVALARQFGVKFQPTVGILHQDQPPETLEKLDETLADLALLPLAAMVSITGITGSGLLAIALRSGLVDADTAWAAANVDEDHNLRLWGEDPEATLRRDKRRRDYDAAVTVLRLTAL